MTRPRDTGKRQSALWRAFVILPLITVDCRAHATIAANPDL
ncbi:MAG TPA: hypothetical protein VNZ26_04310 [Vicinamibacterales bacterium]|nr:hypothetical protein [Vicinamibacterales bacterium]